MSATIFKFALRSNGAAAKIKESADAAARHGSLMSRPNIAACLNFKVNAFFLPSGFVFLWKSGPSVILCW